MLPIEFKNRMIALLGEESEAFFKELEEGEAVKAFRVNEIKISCEDFDSVVDDICMTRAPFPPECRYTAEKFPGSLACHHSGAIYMQDPSAMATVHAVKIEKGMKVLDSCSAPGGKTGQMSQLVGADGIVVANEYDAKRSRILQGNLERMGCVNAVVLNLDTSVLAETYPEKFDVVLSDAPCSGEGMFRKNSLAIEEWSLDNVLMCAERQKEILTNVAKCVAPGGYLIYSTCTFSLEENEMNVEWFLNCHNDFELCDVDDGLKAATADGICFEGSSYDMTKTRRFYPHVSHGEGQYIAVLKRRADVISISAPSNSKKSNKKSDGKKARRDEVVEAAAEFLRDNLISAPDMLLVRCGDYIYMKPRVELPEYGVISAGICVGGMVGRIFVPHHHLFSACGNMFKRRVLIDYSAREVQDYLKGLEIKTDSVAVEFCEKRDGWASVIVGGCAVGGGKISGNVCKNHYPKGLRNKQ